MLKIYQAKELTPELRKSIITRKYSQDQDAFAIVQEIIEDVKTRGVDAVREYTEKFDKIRFEKPSDFSVKPEEFDEAEKRLAPEIKAAFSKAAENIRAFHELQRKNIHDAETTIAGARLGYRYRPVKSAGIYIPGGKASYPSTVLMGMIPAKVAGVERTVLMTPPSKDGSIMDAVLFCAKLAGATEVIKVGGAQGIAAAAYGVFDSAVEIIVGPGNRYVTAAKALLAAEGTIKMDLPAGPSEVIVIADESANAKFAASDLLSQAEHGEDSPAILLTNKLAFAEAVDREIEKGIAERPDRRIMKETSIREHSCAIVFDNLDDAFVFSNDYAPEHLEICTKDPESDLKKVENAGSIFLGHYAPVALGDYFSGTNHILPTGGAGRFYAGLGVDAFLKRVTYQYPTKESLKNALEPILIMSKVEGLEHEHGHSVEVRFKD